MDYKNTMKKMAALKQAGNLLDITWDEVDRLCSLLGYYSASSGNFLPTFLDNLSVQSSRSHLSNLCEIVCPIFKLTLEDGTDDFAAEARNQARHHASRQET
jgi:hypothetical protein